MIGFGCGSFGFGLLSDSLGRRHTLLIAILTASLASLACSRVSFTLTLTLTLTQAPTYWLYALFRLVVGCGSGNIHLQYTLLPLLPLAGMFYCSFAMVLEVVGKRQRCPCLFWVSYSTLQVLYGGAHSHTVTVTVTVDSAAHSVLCTLPSVSACPYPTQWA